MDLPSIARVTKIPQEKLEKMARSMPVFAPGVESLFEMGAVTSIWDARQPFDEQLRATLEGATARDERRSPRQGARRSHPVGGGRPAGAGGRPDGGVTVDRPTAPTSAPARPATISCSSHRRAGRRSWRTFRRPCRPRSGARSSIGPGRGGPSSSGGPAPGDPAGAVPVGVPLPPSLGKLRVRLAIPASARRTEREAVDLGQGP